MSVSGEGLTDRDNSVVNCAAPNNRTSVHVQLPYSLSLTALVVGGGKIARSKLCKVKQGRGSLGASPKPLSPRARGRNGWGKGWQGRWGKRGGWG